MLSKQQIYIVVATTFLLVRSVDMKIGNNINDDQITKTDESEYRLEESFGYLTGHAYRSINRRLKNLFEAEGHPITVEQFGVLVHLWEEDGRCQNEIGCILDKDRPGISRLIRNLELKQLVQKRPDAEDSRKKIIYLTQEGKDLEEASKKLALKVYKECASVLLPDEIEKTKHSLRQIKNKLN